MWNETNDIYYWLLTKHNNFGMTHKQHCDNGTRINNSTTPYSLQFAHAPKNMQKHRQRKPKSKQEKKAEAASRLRRRRFTQMRTPTPQPTMPRMKKPNQNQTSEALNKRLMTWCVGITQDTAFLVRNILNKLHFKKLEAGSLGDNHISESSNRLLTPQNVAGNIDCGIKCSSKLTAILNPTSPEKVTEGSYKTRLPVQWI